MAQEQMPQPSALVRTLDDPGDVGGAAVALGNVPDAPETRRYLGMEAAERRRVTAAVLLPFLVPQAPAVSTGLANGSNVSFVQSSSIARNVPPI